MPAHHGEWHILVTEMALLSRRKWSLALALTSILVPDECPVD